MNQLQISSLHLWQHYLKKSCKMCFQKLVPTKDMATFYWHTSLGWFWFCLILAIKKKYLIKENNFEIKLRLNTSQKMLTKWYCQRTLQLRWSVILLIHPFFIENLYQNQVIHPSKAWTTSQERPPSPFSFAGLMQWWRGRFQWKVLSALVSV